SSDVCSSDLVANVVPLRGALRDLLEVAGDGRDDRRDEVLADDLLPHPVDGLHLEPGVGDGVLDGGAALEAGVALQEVAGGLDVGVIAHQAPPGVGGGVSRSTLLPMCISSDCESCSLVSYRLAVSSSLALASSFFFEANFSVSPYSSTTPVTGGASSASRPV